MVDPEVANEQPLCYAYIITESSHPAGVPALDMLAGDGGNVQQRTDINEADEN